MQRTYTLTYDVVTPESAEEGDFSDTGFGRSPADRTSVREGACIDPDPEVRRAALKEASDAATDTIEPDEDQIEEHGGESAAAVALMVGRLTRRYGATEPSCSPTWAPGTWYTEPDGSTDFATGAVTRVSVHLDGWTDDEQRAIYAGVRGRR